MSEDIKKGFEIFIHCGDRFSNAVLISRGRFRKELRKHGLPLSLEMKVIEFVLKDYDAVAFGAFKERGISAISVSYEAIERLKRGEPIGRCGWSLKKVEKE